MSTTIYYYKNKLQFAFVLFLIVSMFSGCKAIVDNVTKVETAKLSEDQVSFYTQALPRWVFHTSTQNDDKEYKSTGSWFTFFEDSTFIVTDKLNSDYKLSTQLKDVGKFVEAGQYKFINDSILEINYNDGNVPPMFCFDYDPLLNKSVKVRFNGTEGFYVAHKLFSSVWDLINQGDLLIPEDANFKENSCDTVTRFSTVDLFSFSVDSLVRKEVLLRMNIGPHYSVYLTRRSKGTQSGDSISQPPTSTYEFVLNISDVDKNYLNIVDLREDKSDVINMVTVYTYGNVVSRWYPDQLRFKRKGDRLVLLNHDGSESKQVIKMYFPNKK